MLFTRLSPSTRPRPARAIPPAPAWLDADAPTWDWPRRPWCVWSVLRANLLLNGESKASADALLAAAEYRTLAAGKVLAPDRTV